MRRCTKHIVLRSLANLPLNFMYLYRLLQLDVAELCTLHLYIVYAIVLMRHKDQKTISAAWLSKVKL